MKYFFLVLTVIFSQFANAGSGKALIPHWNALHQSYFFISNITNNSIEVGIKLYDSDGKIINLEEVGLSNQVIIEPKTTKKLQTKTYLNKFGFGSISWKNVGTEDDEVAITVAVQEYNQRVFFMLNDGQPF
ncbi:hypothetical protein ABXV22_17400 [Vibrio rotiferianus]|uniref:hypothetical protein n=1 Tax=Vibrio rotiferianus TaxID=190895 RepID=UPI003391F851